jgi:predicted alpha/beta superfamily hydrolase
MMAAMVKTGFCGLAMLAALCGVPANALVEATAPRQSLQIGEYRSLASAVYGEEVRYFLKLPDSYSVSTRSYPVLFVMEAGSPSTAANAYATLETLGREMIPEMILIGIVNSGRASSYFPRNPNGTPGGADALIRFLAEELIPHVDAQYRTQRYRILFGESNAGLFALYAFLTRPDAIDACIVASPTLGWCPDYMKEVARTNLAKRRDWHGHLYLNRGGKDFRALVAEPFPAFTDLLRAEAPSGLVWKSETLEPDGHVPLASLHNGLLFIFPDFFTSDEVKAAGLKAVDAHFAELSKRYGIELQASEETVFDLSHSLYRQKKYPEAIVAFRAVLERYPKSLRARMFLGDAYRDSGNLDKAREAYQQCLESDPQNNRVRQRLEGLRQIRAKPNP